MPSPLRGIIYDIFGEILDIAGIVVDPRQGHASVGVRGRVPGVGGRYLRSRGCRRCAEVEFVYIHLVESLVEVLLGAPLQELRLDLGLGYFGNGDRAELVEASVAYLAVENHLLRRHIGTVDMAEDCKVLRAVFERKGDCQRVAVAAAEHTVFGNILKRSALLQGREPVVDVDLHKISTFTVVSAKVLFYERFEKDG